MTESIRTYQKLLCEYVDAQAVRDREIKRLRALSADLLAALKLVRETVLREGGEAELTALDAAVAAAEAAGIKAGI